MGKKSKNKKPTKLTKNIKYKKIVVESFFFSLNLETYDNRQRGSI